ncbi:DUF2264 domain-containing protein [Paenibacillus sp. NEAU-GSW1]|uniref:DUF2264 domain-containing protein n=1 Tax=Paenibacillus sp. NEAU-GSW1 TaxID=2682486 RepID=UPI0012E2A0A1|nr:DUF2264 domain-containing protein [Paenibacillus sp. NEAU-GSW1]MUT65207.1 DUF2264 domain-containing protein [Paenibacillus sp. NEAU-GSW1]
MRSTALSIESNPLITRKHMQDAVHQLCDPLIPYYSAGKAHLKLGAAGSGCTNETAEMEGFSRVLWGLASLAAGGGDSALWEIYREGIRNGTNPAHEEYWGVVNDYDQKLVEMAAIGFAIAIAPEQIWMPLTAEEQQRFIAWLNQMNVRPLYDCNWLFFLVVVNLGFKKAGLPYDQLQMTKNLERIDDFYLAEGWYADGIGGHCDYYGPFGIHYYGLLYAAWMGEEDPERAALYKKRAANFAQTFIYWFAEDGSALPYGRSLAYRFSQAAFWSALAYAETEAVPYGVMKGIILRHLRWWFRQPIFQSDGTLTIGYRYPNLIMAENYNAPGSPYWAMKAFLPLALPVEHPFWQAEELPLPKLNEWTVQAPPHLVICRQKAGDHVVAFNSGHHATNDHTHTAAKYEKFAYSNRFGFSVPRAEYGLGQGAYDSMLALSEGDRIYRVKRMAEQSKIDGRTLYMKWKPWRDVEVQTWIIAGTPWHVRVHCITTPRYLEVADGGFALGVEDDGGKRSLKLEQSEGEAWAASAWGMSGIKLLYGGGAAELVHPNANTNVLHARTVIPTVVAKLEPGIHWLATGVYGDPAGTPQGETPRVEEIDGKLYIHLNEIICIEQLSFF